MFSPAALFGLSLIAGYLTDKEAIAHEYSRLSFAPATACEARWKHAFILKTQITIASLSHTELKNSLNSDAFSAGLPAELSLYVTTGGIRLVFDFKE